MPQHYGNKKKPLSAKGALAKRSAAAKRKRTADARSLARAKPAYPVATIPGSKRDTPSPRGKLDKQQGALPKSPMKPEAKDQTKPGTPGYRKMMAQLGVLRRSGEKWDATRPSALAKRSTAAKRKRTADAAKVAATRPSSRRSSMSPKVDTDIQDRLVPNIGTPVKKRRRR
jgi:hypothetical protein